MSIYDYTVEELDAMWDYVDSFSERTIPITDIYLAIPFVVDDSKVESFVDAYLKGTRFPPVEVYPETINDKYVIKDGLHRISAYLRLNIATVTIRQK